MEPFAGCVTSRRRNRGNEILISASRDVMPQIFQPRSNTWARAGIAGVLLLLGGLAWGVHAVYWSPYTTRVEAPVEQPVPFSHKHHAGGIGIDCRYCHSS